MNAASDLETAELAKRHAPKEATPHVLPTETSLSDYDGFEKPTEEEMATLRRVSGKIPWAAYTIAFVELCERFSYYGTTAVCKLCKSLYF
jgi:POT family proton-dependent oligopeptide transporter